MANPYKNEIMQGEKSFQAGKIEEALQVFREVIEEDPENVEALNDAGVVYSELGQTEKALDHFQCVLDLQPSNEDALFNLVNELVSHDEYQRARRVVESYSAYIENPLTEEELTNLIDPTCAESNHTDIDSSVNQRIAEAEKAFERNDIATAKHRLEQLLAENPNHAEILNDLAVITASEEEYEDAVGYLLHALKSAPHDSDTRQNIIDLLQLDSVRKLIQPEYESLVSRTSLDKNERSAVTFLTRVLNAGTEFRAGLATIDITPKVNEKNAVALQGYAGPLRKANAALTPLILQILMLEDENYNKSIIISADLFGFDDAMVSQIRKLLEPWGVPPEAILLNASHTHYAPGTVSGLPEMLGPYYQQYASAIINGIAGQLEGLYESLQPCLLFSGETALRIGINRRLSVNGNIEFGENPDGYYPDITPFLEIHLTNDEEKLFLVNHGCHPTGLGNADVIFADYPVYLREFLKNASHVKDVMFLQGAGGDVKEAVLSENPPRFTRTPEEVAKNGELMAEAIATASNNTLQFIHGPLTACSEELRIPYQDYDIHPEIARYGQSTNGQTLQSQWAGMMESSDGKSTETELSLEVNFVRLGDRLSLVTFPGEPVGELAEAVVRNLKETNVFVLGYTNGLKAYLPTSEQIKEGGYESDTSRFVYGHPAPFQPKIEEKILDGIDMLSQRTRNGRAAYGREHESAETGEAFFALSSGRCGTKTLAHLLNTATNARVYHHPRPYLINQTLQAYHENIDCRKTFWSARRSVITDAWNDERIFGEVDHNMTPFATTIAGEIPDSKFIVLVRNPWDFVRSGMRRDYYNGHPWDSGRLRPEPDHPDFERWQSMSQFEKVCWLWNETYTRIMEYLEDIPDERYTIVKFEDLINDPQTTKKIFQFLELEEFNRANISTLLKKPLNKQNSGDFPTPENWTGQKLQRLRDECLTVIEQFGYEDHLERYTNVSSKFITTGKSGVQAGYQTLLFLEQEGVSTGGHLDHIVPALQTEFKVKYIKTKDLNEAERAIKQADIIWLEWVSQLTAAVTQQIQLLREKPVLCRLHGFEVFTNFPSGVNWDVVDKLIFVANHKREIFFQQFPDPDVDSTVIRNGVNVESYTIADGKTNTKNLLLLGHINYRKGLTLLTQYYYELLKRDPEFHLYIRGDWQDLRYKMAVMTMVKELELENDITFVEEWINDLDTWLADKSHILSFSLEESFHYAIGNGMAAGMKPVIHAWNESREIWPEEFIFRNVDEFLDLMLNGIYKPKRYRELISEHGLTSNHQIRNIQRELESLSNDYFGKSTAVPVSGNTFETNEQFWTARYQQYGDRRTVGHVTWDEEQYYRETIQISEKIEQVLEEYLNGRRQTLLDFGCGVGRFQTVLQKFADEYYGIDIVSDVIEQNKSRFEGNSNVHFDLLSDNQIQYDNLYFDIIFSGFVLQHITDETLFHQYAQQIESKLSDSGVLLLIENIENSDNNEHMVYRSVEDYQSAFRDVQLHHVDTYYAGGKTPHAILIGKKKEESESSTAVAPGTDRLPVKVQRYHNQWCSLLPYDLHEMAARIDQYIEHEGNFVSIKCEQVDDRYWEVEFALENTDAGVFGQYFLYDTSFERLYAPRRIKQTSQRKISKLVRTCLDSPNIKLNDRSLGYVFDRFLRQDVQNNLQEYIWERMYPGTIFTPLRNFLTHMNRYKFVKEQLEGGEIVVDGACGIGYGAKYLSGRVRSVMGIDLSEETIGMAEKYYDASNISWKVMDVLDLDLDDESVDVFTSMETLEHVHPPEKLLEEISRVLRKNGQAFISTPNGKSEKRQNINNPYHEHEYSFDELATMVNGYFGAGSIYGADSDAEFVKVTATNTRKFDNFLIHVTK